jgi:hypothetical protein
VSFLIAEFRRSIQLVKGEGNYEEVAPQSQCIDSHNFGFGFLFGTKSHGKSGSIRNSSGR